MPKSRALWILIGPLMCVCSAARADTWVVGQSAPTIQQALDGAHDGDRIEVPAGVYHERLRVRHSVSLVGHNAVIDGDRRGTVLTIEAPQVLVQGLTIQASGEDLGAPDCCVYATPRAEHLILRNNALRDCAFGAWIHETDHVLIEGNTVDGRIEVRESDRGNGIHLFDGQYITVRNNQVRGVRDGIYVSATHDSEIVGNTVSNQRFGVHYMYSYRNVVRDNKALHNALGIALMESRDLTVERNFARDNTRQGLLFRDVQDSVIRHNELSGNGQGMFFYSSTDNVIEDNVLTANDIGMKVWAGSLRNRVSRNQFNANREQIFYVSSQDLVWGEQSPGNYFSDYLGWDQNGDGIGDRPHRIDSFTANLLHRFPVAAVLLRSPALELLAHLERTLPLLKVPTIIDRAPLMRSSP